MKKISYLFFICFCFLFFISLTKCQNEKIIQPTLTSVKSEGGQIFINNLDSFNVSQISAKFFSTLLKTDIFYCDNIKILNETSITCIVPKGMGVYMVVIKDEINIAPPIFWSYELGYNVNQSNNIINIESNILKKEQKNIINIVPQNSQYKKKSNKKEISYKYKKNYFKNIGEEFPYHTKDMIKKYTNKLKEFKEIQKFI